MSFEHIPKFVWVPIAFLLWAFFLLILVLTCMSYRAKSLEIDLLNLAIKVQYADQQLSIAQKNISTTMDLIDGLTKQLAQSQCSLQPTTNGKQTIGESEPISMHQSQSDSTPVYSSCDFNRPIMQQLQIQKSQLEGISGEIKHIQNNLQSSIQSKDIQQ